MKCPNCGCEDLKVFDSRSAPGNSVRRRRKCIKCGFVFTTYESPVDMAEGEHSFRQITVVGDNFTTQDIQDRILGACSMVEITPTDIQFIMQSVSKKCGASLTSISSQKIDLIILELLRDYNSAFFNAYAMRRFHAKTPQQLLDLWNLGDNLNLANIYKIIQNGNQDDRSE